MSKALATESKSEMDRVVVGLASKSAKIRALAEAGYARADIARYLGIRYQHVRNVLVQDATRATSKSADRPVPVVVGPGGRVVIPAAQRQALGLREGDTLLFWRDGDELRAMSRDAAIRDIQQNLLRQLPRGASAVDDLIAERRREARQEGESDGCGA